MIGDQRMNWTVGKAYFECLGKDFANVLLAQVASGTKPVLHLCFLAVSLGGTTPSARTNGAAKYLWAPPPVHGAFGVMKAEYGIGVSKSPCVRRLWETRDNV